MSSFVREPGAPEMVTPSMLLNNVNAAFNIKAGRLSASELEATKERIRSRAARLGKKDDAQVLRAIAHLDDILSKQAAPGWQNPTLQE